MPPGTYYVGDLKYALSDEEFDEYVSLITTQKRFGHFRLSNGRHFAVYLAKNKKCAYKTEDGILVCTTTTGLIGCLFLGSGEDVRCPCTRCTKANYDEESKESETEEEIEPFVSGIIHSPEEFNTFGNRSVIQFGNMVLVTV